MKLNEKILHCRKRAGLSQEALAERIGVSRQAISKWETGEASPEISKLPLLAQAFAVTTDWLLDETAAPADRDAGPASDSTAPTHTAEAPQSRAACPAWVDKLPDTLASLIRRYGWLVGVRMAIAGAIFTAMGVVARLMSSAMTNTMNDMGSGMFGGLGGSGVTFYDASGRAVSPGSLGLSSTDLAGMGLGGSSGFGFDASAMTQPFDIFCTFFIVIGLATLIGGVLLAWHLKKWGQENA